MHPLLYIAVAVSEANAVPSSFSNATAPVSKVTVTAPPVERNAHYLYVPPVQDTSIIVPIPEADYSLSFITAQLEESVTVDGMWSLLIT